MDPSTALSLVSDPAYALVALGGGLLLIATVVLTFSGLISGAPGSSKFKTKPPARTQARDGREERVKAKKSPSQRSFASLTQGWFSKESTRTVSRRLKGKEEESAGGGRGRGRREPSRKKRR